MKNILLTTALLFPMTAFAGEGLPGSHFIENWDLDTNGRVTLNTMQCEHHYNMWRELSDREFN